MTRTRRHADWAGLRRLISAHAIVDAAAAEARRVTTPLAALSPDDVWSSLVVQIAVVGGAAAGYRLSGSGAIRALLPHALLRLRDRDERLAHVHAVLRSAGVRFVGARAPAAKARAIVALLEHPQVQEDGSCVFGARVRAAAAEERDDVRLRRTIVGWRVPGFGPKSTSDWLNNRGVSTDLIAFDVRVCRVLAAWAGPTYEQARVATLPAYAAAEATCRSELARRLGTCLADIDKRLFMAGR